MLEGILVAVEFRNKSWREDARWTLAFKRDQGLAHDVIEYNR